MGEKNKNKKRKSNNDEEVSKILILIQWCYNTGRKPSMEKANTATKVPDHILNFFSRIIITFRIDDRVRRVSGWDARPLLVSRSSWGRTFLRFLSRFGNFVLPFPKKNPVRTISRARSFVAMFFHRRHGSVSASLRFVPLLPFYLLPSSLFRLFLIQASFPFRVPRVEFARPYLRCVPLVLSLCCFYYFLPFSRHFRRGNGYSSLFRSPPRLFQPP